MKNFMKPIINAIKYWTNSKIEENKAELNSRIDNSQADWTESNPSSDGYVKNRPFYEEVTEESVYEETAITIDSEGYCGNFPNDDKWCVVGETYKVTFDGIGYMCVATEIWETGTLLEFNVNGITVNFWDFRRIKTDSSLAGEHTIKVDKVSTTLVKLDHKYLDLPPIHKGNDYLETALSLNTADNEASGIYSCATGLRTTASGPYSHTEGANTIASSHASHAEGANSQASGLYSHSEGQGTKATHRSQRASGEYNMLDDSTELYAWRGNYVNIVGNGYDDSARSNAHTLDWSGNAWYAGDVYVGSTSGTNRDEGSKKLATEEYTNRVIEENNNSWDLDVFQGEMLVGSFDAIYAKLDKAEPIKCRIRNIYQDYNYNNVITRVNYDGDADYIVFWTITEEGREKYKLTRENSFEFLHFDRWAFESN